VPVNTIIKTTDRTAWYFDIIGSVLLENHLCSAGTQKVLSDSFTFVSLTFKVVDARIDARPGNSTQQRWVPIKTRRWRVGLPASSFDTSFDNDKPASSSFVTLVTLNCVTVLRLRSGW
jgi:hypothetical protein